MSTEKCAVKQRHKNNVKHVQHSVKHVSKHVSTIHGVQKSVGQFRTVSQAFILGGSLPEIAYFAIDLLEIYEKLLQIYEHVFSQNIIDKHR